MTEQPTVEQASRDLGFVRSAVKRADDAGTPAAIFFLWAVIILAAFVLADTRPQWMGIFWGIAGPGGWILSAVLGARYSRRVGQVDRRKGMSHLAHWGGMMAALFLAVLLPLNGLMPWQTLGHLSLLLMALSYFLAGLHLDRATLWLGPWMIGAFLLAIYIPVWNWSAAGLAVAVGLVATPLLTRRARAHATT